MGFFNSRGDVMTKDQLIELLDHQYGGLDYWRLSKRWKRIRHEETASMILRSFEYIAEQERARLKKEAQP